MKNSSQKNELDELIGNSNPILSLKEKIINLSELKIPVYVQGEQGTGKDLIVRLIAKENILHIDCGNFESDWNLLIEKYSNRISGKLHIRGESIKLVKPLYFDKLELLSTEGQAILFRILDNQDFITSKKEMVEFSSRIFLSSNKHLPQLVKDGLFRKDLFQKINVICLNTVSLREIRSDIPLLVNYFVNNFKNLYKKNIVRLSEKLIQFILQHNWPGNVGQLKNMLEGMIVLSSEKVLDISQVPKDFISASSLSVGGKLQIIPGVPILEYEKEIIRENLRSTSGNREKCARMLGISERTLYRKIKEYQLG